MSKQTKNTINTSKWVELYADQLFFFAYTRIRNAAVAEDLVQDSFLSALKAKERFKGNSTEKSWLYSILKNKIIDYFRKASTKNEMSILNDKGSWKNIQGFVTSKDYACKLIENKEFYIILEKCLVHLPTKTQMAFRYKYIDDLDTAEICKELDITVSNYWLMLHRARLSLRDCLTKNKIK